MCISGLVPFLSASGTRANELAQTFASKLGKVETWFRRQKRYAYIASSLLLVYDALPFDRHSSNNNTKVQSPNESIAADQDNVLTSLDNACDVRMIDFAHVDISDQTDDNYLGGVSHLRQFFSQCGQR